MNEGHDNNAHLPYVGLLNTVRLVIKICLGSGRFSGLKGEKRGIAYSRKME